MTPTIPHTPCIVCGTLVPLRTRCPTCHYGDQGPEGWALVVLPWVALGLVGSAVGGVLVWAWR